MAVGEWDGFGNYVRVYRWTQDLIDRIPVTAKRMDDEFDALCRALGNCLTRDGQGGSTGPIIFQNGAHFNDGTYAAPSITFINDLDTGLYRNGSNDLGISANGQRVANFTPADVSSLTPSVSQLFQQNGTTYHRIVNADVDNPSVGAGYYLVGGTVSGRMLAATNDALYIGPTSAGHSLKVDAVGGIVAEFASTFINLNKQAREVPGTSAAPSYSFSGDLGTGMYRFGAGSVGFAGNGALLASLDATAATIKSTKLLAPVGTGNAAPGLTFDGDPDTGWWRVVDGSIRTVCNGTPVLDLTPTAISMMQPVTLTNTLTLNNALSVAGNATVGGTLGVTGNTTVSTLSASGLITANGGISVLGAVGLSVQGIISAGFGSGTAPNIVPSYTFNTDPNTGIYSPVRDALSIVAAGSAIATFSAATPNPYISMGFPVWLANGINTAPSLAFASDTDTGIFWNPTFPNAIQFAANGAQQASLSPAGLTVVPQILGNSGLTGAPAHSFAADILTGMYLNAASTLGFSCGGADQLTISPTLMQVRPQIQQVTGTVAVPSYSFNADSATGIYRYLANTIGFACAGSPEMFLGSTGLTVRHQYFSQQHNFNANPAYIFVDGEQTGMRRVSSTALALVGGNVDIAIFSAAGGIQAIDGTRPNPGFSFINDPNTGFARLAPDCIYVECGGADAGVFSAASPFTLPATTATKAHLHLTPGAAVTTLTDGDLWLEGTVLKYRAGGVTYTVTKTP